MKNGGIIPDAEMTWVREGPAYGLMDAAKGFGYIAAQRADVACGDAIRAH